MGIATWRSKWRKWETVLTKAGFTGRWDSGNSFPPRFEIGRRATARELKDVENQLGEVIPESLRRVFRDFSAKVCIEWQLREISPADAFRQIFAGECRWDLQDLPRLRKVHRDWIEKCFTARSTWDWPDKAANKKAIAYDLVWHNKFPILEIGNGVMLGIELGRKNKGATIYLSHDDGAAHGYCLGKTFEDYIDRLTELAFVGAEEWQLHKFLPKKTSGLKVSGPQFNEWRRWLIDKSGIDI